MSLARWKGQSEQGRTVHLQSKEDSRSAEKTGVGQLERGEVTGAVMDSWRQQSTSCERLGIEYRELACVVDPVALAKGV